jgi:hypothetical protein
VGFLVWLEASNFAEWVRSSYTGYPIMIASHAIGMAIMVGLSFALSMRLLGFFPEIQYSALNRFLGIAWGGFVLNTLSGTGLFSAQATSYVTDLTFLLKMLFVVLGMVTVAAQQAMIRRHAGGWSEAVPPSRVRLLAMVSIVCWVVAMIIGRLIAYV